MQWLQALKKVEEEKVLNLHTDLKEKETSIYKLESHISQNNVDIEEQRKVVWEHVRIKKESITTCNR